jgi:restriction endonuclease Mrr
MESLYTVIDGSGNRPDWFQFERELYKVMDSMGFAVEHISTSVRGDNGVDVFATKGDDLEKISWVIQCKCYRPRRKVGPSIVRELVGTLAGYSRGTRGMIATTSSFSRTAISDAERHDIRLIDGAEFLKMCGRA